MDVEALILFMDIRGFTRWSSDTEVFAHLDEFVGSFMDLVRELFRDDFVKCLGDGAMIVRRLDGDAPRTVGEVLSLALTTVRATNTRFRDLCAEFAVRVGHHTELELGWGVVRGTVKPFQGDFVGANINKCARLCELARPHGIVIDADDFPTPPTNQPEVFVRQTRRLNGVPDDVRVWVTKEVASKFVARERLRETPEVHVAGVCIDTGHKDGPRVMIAHRTRHRRLFPELWEGCGGQLARSESFAAGVERHYRLEMSIEVRTIEDIHCFYEIREPDEALIPGIRFLCERVGTVEPASHNHDAVRWVSMVELANMPANQFVGHFRHEAITLIKRWLATQPSS